VLFLCSSPALVHIRLLCCSRVLSGSKYGLRQTRGKFGLGAKMALIWSKQSTGMPVEVRYIYISISISIYLYVSMYVCM